MTGPDDDDLETLDPFAPRPEPPAADAELDAAAEAGPTASRGPRPLVVGVLVAMLLAALGGFIVASALESGTEFPSARAQPTDPDADVLGGLGLQQADVADTHSVVLVPDGNLVEGATTLDFCDASYPSETLRTARLQVASLNRGDQTLAMSTEAVLYQSPNATAQAFRELEATADRCSSLLAKQGDDWPKPDGVERLVYDVRDTNARAAAGDHTLLVYLRRGRVLLALYFNTPDGAQSPVGGRTAIEGITEMFQDRLAALPASVVG